MGKAELIQNLRAQIGEASGEQKQFWEAPGLRSGVAKGIVAELCGHAKTEWLFQLFLLNPDHLIYWCERENRIHPTAIQQRGIPLNRVQFLNYKSDLQQVLRLALETTHYPFLVAPSEFTEVTVFQRLHLLAEKSNATVFLLKENGFSSGWPISLQLEINNSDEGFEIDVLRQRHSRAEL